MNDDSTSPVDTFSVPAEPGVIDGDEGDEGQADAGIGKVLGDEPTAEEFGRAAAQFFADRGELNGGTTE